MNFLKENGQSDALKANAQHSDLLPAVYEGNIYVLGFQYFSLGMCQPFILLNIKKR